MELPCARTKRHPTTAYTGQHKKKKRKKIEQPQFLCLKKLYTVPLKSKALFTRREVEPAARVTLARGLQ